MATTFYESRGGMLDPVEHKVKESVDDVTGEVNAALASNLKYVTFTHEDDGKQFSVAAKDVGGIKEA
jgi:hypothetical protein